MNELFFEIADVLASGLVVWWTPSIVACVRIASVSIASHYFLRSGLSLWISGSMPL